MEELFKMHHQKSIRIKNIFNKTVLVKKGTDNRNLFLIKATMIISFKLIVNKQFSPWAARA